MSSSGSPATPAPLASPVPAPPTLVAAPGAALRPGSGPASVSRRRQRSTRLVTAVVLLLAAAAAVVAAAVASATGDLSWAYLTVAGALAVALGAAAVRITHAELLAARRAAAADRATQARGYLVLTASRIAEHAGFVDHVEAGIAARERGLHDLEAALAAAQRRAAVATRARNDERHRAEAAEHERDTLATHLDRSETTCAEAVVRVAELEGEIDVLRSELDAVTAAWRSYQVRHPA